MAKEEAGDKVIKETALTEAIVALINSAVPQEIIDSIKGIINIPETLENQIFELITKTFGKIKFNELKNTNIEKIMEQYATETKETKFATLVSKNNQYEILDLIAHSIICSDTKHSAIKENTTTNELDSLFIKYRKYKNQQADIKRLANEAAKKLADEAAEANRLTEAQKLAAAEAQKLLDEAAATETQRLAAEAKKLDEAKKARNRKIKIGTGVIFIFILLGAIYLITKDKPTGEYDEYNEYDEYEEY